jgi:hypothetical protein
MVRDAKVLRYSSIGLLIVSLLVIGYAGIRADDGSASARSGVRYIDDDPRILVHDFPIELQALITGVLAYRQADGCLVVKDWDGDRVPVWREGAEPVLEHGKRGVRFGDGTILLEGDGFTASGGQVPLGDGSSNRCARVSEMVYVLNSDVVPGRIHE